MAESLSEQDAILVGVGLLLFFDTVCTAVACIGSCFAVLPLGPALALTNLRLYLAPLAVQIITTYISALISQLFLCNLYFVLTGHKIVTGTIVILIFVHLHSTRQLAFSVGAVSCAATDLIIAVCLAWKFWSMMEGTRQHHSTRSLLRRILMLSVSTGAICAGNTLLMMILLLNGSEGRVYALTLLGNFLVGIPARAQAEAHPSLRIGTIMSTGTVVFRSNTADLESDDVDADADAVLSPRNAPKSSDPLRPNGNHHESLQLDELALGPRHGKDDG
ncbi:hypothetical protein K438DRAFT_1766999 [Mycena galopus ATCC 62051]|nr:hypothetical protein K438DRAFT_1766999 [Mycena galopus ATCC 62051]